MTSTPHTPPVRNPGPSWGYRFLRICDRFVPEALFRPARAFGTWIALLNMPVQRGHSRDYLRVVLGREPSHRDIFRHFFAFEEVLMLKLRVANGLPHRGVIAPGAEDVRRFLNTNQPAFLGTFHVGQSDLIGFVFGGQENRRVSMIRQRVGNSHDTEKLGAVFGQWLSLIWVNEGENLLFALKTAISEGDSIALKCDRLEFSSKAEPFEFLGARRLFPFTIYHLALIFDRTVLMTVGVPGDNPSESIAHCAPPWRPDPALKRAQNLALAREHFQSFLRQVETVLRANPYWWFNFLPLNPEAPAA